MAHRGRTSSSSPFTPRARLLNLELFCCLAEAHVVIADRREDYIRQPPHSALGRTAPAASAAAGRPAHPCHVRLQVVSGS
ncbi:MAG: transposase [Actinobacteria bacterium]|nr:transposase [Actinomycetota bacterium]